MTQIQAAKVQENSIRQFLAPTLLEIKKILKEKRGQFMILSPDRALLHHLVVEIKKASKYKAVDVANTKHEDPNGKIFFISLKNTSSMMYQSILYHYLELSEIFKCFVCFISTSSLSLNCFEKRVRSRFKNRLFFIPFFNINFKNEKSSAKNMCTELGLEECKNANLIAKYNLKPFSSSFLFDMLEPVHFILIMIANHKGLIIKECYDQFRMVVNRTPEIKNIDALKVLYSSYDLMDAGIINSKGKYILDYNEFQEFINLAAPEYIKRLMRSFRNIVF